MKIKILKFGLSEKHTKFEKKFLMKLSPSRNGENEESLFSFLGEWGNGE